MGCGSSSPTGVVEATKDKNGKLEDDERGVRPAPMGAADDDDLPTEVIPESLPAIKPPMAFEIPLTDDDPIEGLVKKYPPRPPRRLQRLNTMDPTSTTTTLQELQDKLESAERRRQTILQSRMASANKATRQIIKMSETAQGDEENIDMDEIMRSPTKDLTELKNIINIEEHGIIK